MKHILIAEDDESVRDILSLYLKKEGYQVSSVSDGKHALNFISRTNAAKVNQVDLLLTDLKMPNIGGMDLLDELQKKEISIPTVVISADQDKNTLKEAFKRGCYDYIEKPLEGEEFVQRCKDVFVRVEKEKSQQMRQIESRIVDEAVKAKRKQWQDNIGEAEPFQCPYCRAEIELLEAAAGVDRVQCPACDNTVMVPMPGLEKGIEIGGFTLQEKIGSGGMGEVWLAYQTTMNRKVALKILSPALTRGQYFVTRFMHEVEIVGKLSHNNIVTAFDAGVDKGIYYMAISYIEGVGLREKLRNEKVLSEKEALRIIRSVADALRYAWNNYKILHRDIKPSNIMIDRENIPKLMDMGISKCMSEDLSLTSTGIVVGSPYYMSPEQAKNDDRIDFRADLYSLGATLYHLVTGTIPYVGKSAMSVLSQHITEKLPPPESRNPNVSEGCSLLIHIMMAKRREDRHKSWEALIDDIDRVLAGQLPGTKMNDSPVSADELKKQRGVNDLTLKEQIKERGESNDAGDRKKYSVSVKVPLITVISTLVALLLINIGFMYGKHSSKEEIKRLDEELKQLQWEKKKNIRMVIRGLRKKAWNYMLKHEFKKAAEVYINYSGKYADETLTERRKLAEDCFDQEKAIMGTEEDEEMQAGEEKTETAENKKSVPEE